MGAGKQWSEIEDLFSSQAYIKASMSSTTGTKQKKSIFEKQIEHEYKKLVNQRMSSSEWVPKQARTGTAISRRFVRAIKVECLRFEGCVQRVKKRNLTGAVSDNDILSIATALYNDHPQVLSSPYRFCGENPISSGPPFPFLLSYKWLRTQYLWDYISKAQNSGNSIQVSFPSSPPLSNNRQAMAASASGNTVNNGSSSTNRDDSDRLMPVSDNLAPTTVPTMPDDRTPSTSVVESVPDTETHKRPLGAKKQIEKKQMTLNIENSLRMNQELLENFLKQADERKSMVQSLVSTFRDRAETDRQREERELFASDAIPKDVRDEYFRMRARETLSNMRKTIGESSALNSVAGTLIRLKDSNINQHGLLRDDEMGMVESVDDSQPPTPPPLTGDLGNSSPVPRSSFEPRESAGPETTETISLEGGDQVLNDNDDTLNEAECHDESHENDNSNDDSDEDRADNESDVISNLINRYNPTLPI